jgi:hypothetical protein
MALRNHTYTISPKGQSDYARIVLFDQDEIGPNAFVTGRWEHTDESSDGKAALGQFW